MAKIIKTQVQIPREQFEPDKTLITNKDTEITPVFSGPRVLAIIDDSKKSKLMLIKLKERGVNIASEIKADLSKNKDILDVVKSEKEKGNEYQVIFLPITNTDFNKNSQGFLELRRECPTVNFYFQDHDDVYIANQIYLNKIE